MKVQTRIYAGFAATLALALGLASFGLYELSGISTQVHTMDALAANVSRVLATTTEIEAIRRTEVRYRLLPDAATQSELKEHSSRARTLLTEAVGATLSEDHRRIYNGVKQILQSHDENFDRFVHLLATVAAERTKLFSVGDELAAKTTELFDVASASGNFENMKQAAITRGAIFSVRVANWRHLATNDKDGVKTFKAKQPFLACHTDAGSCVPC